MSDVHVLVCSDVFSKSALGEMWVKCIKCTCWLHSACSDGSGINVYDILRIKTLVVICSGTAL